MNCKLKSYKNHRASKVFECLKCSKEVQVKDRYTRFKCVTEEGIVSSVKMCARCSENLKVGLRKVK